MTDLQSFPTSKISEVESKISKLIGLNIKLNINYNTDYRGDKFETLTTFNLIDELSKLAKTMWTSYIIKVKFGIFEKEQKIVCVVDANYKNTSGGSNGQQIAKFELDL